MLRLLKNPIVFASLFLTGACPFLEAARPAQEYYARVLHVTSGDRLEVNYKGHRQFLHIYGVECPASGRWAARAKQFTQGIAAGRGAHVQIHPTDKPDSSRRRAAQVNFIGGRGLGEELLRNGLARWSRESAPHDKQLITLEGEARAAHKGLWADPSAFRTAALPHHTRKVARRHKISHESTTLTALPRQ